MNLNPVEWSKAQDLLVELVQALTPLTTERIVPASFFLSRRFFMPPALMQEEAQPIRHPVRILTTLQKQVETWIGEVPEEEVEAKVSRPKVKIEKGERYSDPKEPPTLSKQAQKLIVQVQEAIVKLATSTNIQTPQEAPLRQALIKLKPQLDRIIDSIAKEEGREGTLPSLQPRSPIAKSSREEILVKLLKPSKGWEAPRFEPAIEKKAPPIDSPNPDKVEPQERRGEGRAPSMEKRQSRNEPEVEKPIPQPVQKEGKALSKPTAVTNVPLAPFISQAKNIIHPEKKKKKRKGFWFKNEEDPEDRS